MLKYGTRSAIRRVAREAASWWYNLAKVAGWELLGGLGYSEKERGQWII